MPWWGGIRVLASRIENTALGLEPGISQRGQLARAATVRDVRFESSAVFRQHIDQLGTNIVRRRFERIQPGKPGPVMEFDGCELREIQERRLLRIDARPLHQDREATIEPVQRHGRVIASQCRQALFEK